MTSTRSNWKTVTRAHPCPICKHADWCSVAADGTAIKCRRVQLGADKIKTDRNGQPYYVHRLASPNGYTNGHTTSQMPTSPPKRRAKPDKLHEVYSALLAQLLLNPPHNASLQARGLGSLAENTELGFRSLPITGRARIARRLHDRFGDEILTVPGFVIKEGQHGPYVTIAGAVGLLIPVRDVEGRIVALIVRRDDEGKGSKYTYVSSKKYGGPGPLVTAHVPTGTPKPTEVIRLTEGPLKAHIAFILDGTATLGLPGLAWKKALPTLAALQSTTVRLAFDMDARRNIHVAGAMRSCVKALENRGLTLELEQWPAEHKGIDDALAASADITVLRGAEVMACLDDIVAAAEAADRAGATQVAADAARATEVPRLSDVGNAMRIVRRHGADVRYCHPQKKWSHFVGTHWAEDETGEIPRRVKETIRHERRRVAELLADEIANAGDEGPDKRKVDALQDELSHMLKWEGDQRIQASVNQAKSEPGIPILPKQLDNDIMLFNVRNGTVDLRTGQLLAHDRNHYITKLADVVYDPNAKCPRWEQFMVEIMGGNTDLVTYLQRAGGYSLTGSVAEQVLFFLHGNGANGKSVFISAMRHVTGDYGLQAVSELLETKPNNTHPTEKADLRGRRFVATVETEQGKKMAERLMKQLTGGDAVKARRMFEDFWEMEPTWKIWLSANHKPVITGCDFAVWRRIRLIPFNETFSGDRADKGLTDKLKAEAPGILAWLVRGCLEWQKHGLSEPDEVRLATAAYQAEMDTLGGFISECCLVHREAKIKAGALLEAFCKWSGAEVSQQDFGRRMGEKGFVSKPGTAGYKFYHGIGLLPSACEGS